jgi:hypothetical protein
MNKYARIAIMVLTFVLCAVVLIMVGFETEKQHANFESPASALGLGLAKFLLAAAVISSIVLAVKNLINNPKGAIMVGAGVVFMLIVFFIGKGLDAGELYIKEGVSEESVSTTVGGLITLTYVMGIISAIVFVGALILNIIKK